LELKPDYPEAHNNLGILRKAQGRPDEAVACYRRALELRPTYFDAHNNLGNAFQTLGKLDDAIACYRRALALKPNLPWGHNNLGVALKDRGNLDESVACFRRTLQLMPGYAEGHNNLGIALKEQGMLDEAADCYRRAVELKPDSAGAHSNLVYTLNFSADCDARQIYAAARRWNQQHAERLAKSSTPHANQRSADRRLRIGYVSPDFRLHPVGRFLLPLVEAHDHREFEIFCYASLPVEDAISERFRTCADVWRSVFACSDEKLAEMIRQDRIDILVDLTMHMADNRLLVFARKPAPVQVTYLAYCGTTGLSAIDYRLSDPYLDPPGCDEAVYSEQTVRLPETYWCYGPPSEAPPCSGVPALQSGHVTFGCLNNFCKVTGATLAAWSRLLQAAPDAHLLLHAQAGGHRDRVRDYLSGQGVSADRLSFAEKVSLAEYFRLYARIDVALDPFPYGGGTTTCDALWMGVPVVSLAGQTAVGRGGLSILTNAGLPELAARDVDDYVRIAAALASDVPRLTELRSTLRERMQRSPLMDASRFARNVEAAYRGMWRRWCEEGPPDAPADAG
jgi:protein O-GlcNAc transferase